jgi:predicted RecA/RadA family phage recombinase
MEATFSQIGEVIHFTPSSARTGGQVVNINNQAGVCINDIAANIMGAAVIRGIVKVQKAQVAIDAGVPIGWDEDGNPYGGTAGSGCATTYLASADFLLGSAVVLPTKVDGVAVDATGSAAIATDTHVYVNLNNFHPEFPTFKGLKYEALTGATMTTDKQDVGKAILVSITSVITLPAIAVGLGPLTFVNVGADGGVQISLSPNASDLIAGPDYGGTDDHDLVNVLATAKQWDYITVDYADATGWKVIASKGTWTTA